jgi:hypothetical protein
MGTELEQPQQYEMFTGALRDRRTPGQKKRYRQAKLPQPISMFPNRGDLIQMDGTARPKLQWGSDIPPETLTLESGDIRPEDVIERERIRAEIALIAPMFPDDSGDNSEEDEETTDEDEGSDEGDKTHSYEERCAAATEELYAICLDISQTIAATPDVLQSQAMCLALATLEAHTKGVDQATITKLLKMTQSARPQPLNQWRKPPSTEAQRTRRTISNEASYYPTSKLHLKQRMERLRTNHQSYLKHL